MMLSYLNASESGFKIFWRLSMNRPEIKTHAHTLPLISQL